MIHNGVMIKPVRIPEKRFRAPGLSPWEPPERRQDTFWAMSHRLWRQDPVVSDPRSKWHYWLLQHCGCFHSQFLKSGGYGGIWRPTLKPLKRILLPKCLKPHSQQNIQGHEHHQFGCSSVFGERVYCQCSMLWTLPSLDPKELINMGQNRNETMSWARIYRNRITLFTSWFIHSYTYTHANVYIYIYIQS